MNLNETASAERLHISFFGLTNAGKSSVVNAVTNQELSVVSNVKGTTTDPVKKAMELLPLGAVVITDTAGIDDNGEIGFLRVEKTKQILNKTDIAVLVVDSVLGKTEKDEELITAFKEKNIPFVVAFNKCDLLENLKELNENEIFVSAVTGYNIKELKELLGKLSKASENKKEFISDIVKSGETVVLVTPIDSSAPKGRLILPQQHTIRALLDIGATVVVTKETELKNTLASLNKSPDLVITDSQVFKKVSDLLSDDIPLTSFSILFARYKGELDIQIDGVNALKKLQNGDTVLISEGCTHHRQCGDIGTEKLPEWIKKYTQKELNFEFTSGGEFSENLKKYKLVIHCGGCMLNEKEMKYRINTAKSQNTPITNYGTVIAEINGILERATLVFVNK